MTSVAHPRILFWGYTTSKWFVLSNIHFVVVFFDISCFLYELGTCIFSCHKPNHSLPYSAKCLHRLDHYWLFVVSQPMQCISVLLAIFFSEACESLIFRVNKLRKHTFVTILFLWNVCKFGGNRLKRALKVIEWMGILLKIRLREVAVVRFPGVSFRRV